MFISQLDLKHRLLKGRIDEIRAILTTAVIPAADDPGLTHGIRLALDVRDRVALIQERHQFRSAKEVIYKAMLIGLVTLERLEPAERPSARARPDRRARVLSEDEISRIKEVGFNAAKAG